MISSNVSLFLRVETNLNNRMLFGKRFVRSYGGSLLLVYKKIDFTTAKVSITVYYSNTELFMTDSDVVVENKPKAITLEEFKKFYLECNMMNELDDYKVNYYLTTLIEGDKNLLFKWATDNATSPKIMNLLALIYHHPSGFDRILLGTPNPDKTDYDADFNAHCSKKAYEWFKKSSEMGDAFACVELFQPWVVLAIDDGARKGLGLPEDEDEDKDVDMDGKTELDEDRIYYDMSNSNISKANKDKIKAKCIQWLNQAVDVKYPTGYHYLSMCYNQGFCVEEDKKKGFELGLLGADAGCMHSMLNSAKELISRQKDLDKAQQYLEKAEAMLVEMIKYENDEDTYFTSNLLKSCRKHMKIVKKEYNDEETRQTDDCIIA